MIGNPPYQDVMESGGRKAYNHNLWEQFLLKGLEITEDNGYLVLIIPTSWMSPAWKFMESTFRKYTMHHIEINTIGKFFPGVGSQFSWFILQKIPPSPGHKTKFVSSFQNHQYEFEEVFSDVPFMAQLLSSESVSILKKFYNFSGTRFNLAADSYLHATGKKQHLSEERDSSHTFPLKHTTRKTKWSSIPHTNQLKLKVIACLSGNLMPEFDRGVHGTTQAYMYSVVDSISEGEAKEALLKSKLFTFVFTICKWSGFNIQKVFANLPFPVLSSYTDEEIYKALSISNEERVLIEKVVNK